MKTQENNKLIAEFMGADFHERSTMSAVSRQVKYQPHISELNYHTSWDWIMPVVEKIDQIGASVIIGRMFCEIKYIDPLNQSKEFQVRIASGVKINAINGAVLDFIQWYNENVA